MDESSALRKISLPLLVALGVLYLFGMRSGVTTLALLIISGVVLYLVMSSILSGAGATQSSLDSCEKKHGFAGWNFRVFIDEQGAIWLRATDLKRFLEYNQSNRPLKNPANSMQMV